MLNGSVVLYGVREDDLQRYPGVPYLKGILPRREVTAWVTSRLRVNRVVAVEAPLSQVHNVPADFILTLSQWEELC